MGPDISVTKENTKVFPIHSHGTWEFMCYTKGDGVLVSKDESISFKE